MANVCTPHSLNVGFYFEYENYSLVKFMTEIPIYGNQEFHFWNCFLEICAIFPIVCFLKSLFTAIDGCHFLLLLLNHKENIGSSDKIMKPEEFLEGNILVCYVELSHFVFFIKDINSINYETPTSTVI